MIKNASNLYPFALQDQLSNGLTGQTPSVFLRQDNGSFAAASGSVTEVDSINYPGLYQITLTATECNCNVLTIAVSLPDGQEPAILDVVYMQAASGGATPQQIWEYAGGRTVTNTIPSASDNATAVWGAQTKIVTIDSTQAATLATAAALSTVGDNVTAVKAKTDNLPASPAAVGSAMTLTEAYDAAKTASQFDVSTDAVNLSINSVNAVQSGLSTFNPATDSVTINSTQAATFASASSITPILALLETLYSGLFHWEVQNNELTIYDSDGLAISSYTLTKDATGNIIAVTPEDGE